jgi:long-chain acyl-CoA synthetase
VSRTDEPRCPYRPRLAHPIVNGPFCATHTPYDALMDSLLDLLEESVAAFGDRPMLGLRRDDGSDEHWTGHELDRRSRLAAWRLRAAGLKAGDRLLTWSPSTPELPAAYFGAIRAGIVIVPLDLRMAPDAIERIADKAEAAHLAIGTGRDAPDPREAGLERFPTTTMDGLCAEADDAFPPDWETQLLAWPRPKGTDLLEIIFTSGTTGTPKGVMLTHANVLATVEVAHNAIRPQEHRLVSLLPLSHLMEQAVALFYAITVGADVLYVRSRNPRVIFEAIRDHRVTTMLVVPQIMELFWSAIEREVDRSGRRAAFDGLRRVARRLPYPVRRVLFRRVHSQLGGGLNLFVSAAAFLPPALQQAWEDIGVVVMQGYGATECGPASATSKNDHALGTVGRPIRPVKVKLAEDGEILESGPTVFQGYWRDPEATAAAFTPDGWYRTGDIGRFDEAGHLILMGRVKDIIVLPNGLNVYPEDIENALRTAGIRDSVVLETRPGRIEAIVLPPGPPVLAARAPDGSRPGTRTQQDAPAVSAVEPVVAPAQLRARIDAAIRSANATLAVHQRVAGWRLWPGEDFPRTHTLKVRRDQVRRWAVVDAPLPVEQGD